MTALDQSAPGLPADDLCARARRLAEPALRAAVGTLPDSTRLIAGYHFGWSDRDGAPATAAGGKAIRPALALLAAEAVGGGARAALPAAVAVELVHAFSLLHDDVMDADQTRRHRPTAWAVYGVGAAILAGDALLALAFDTLAAAGRPADRAAAGRLSAAVQRLIDGQYTDVAFENRTDVDLADCVRMVEGKTGALFACACALGALAGGGTPHQVGALHAFGERLGVAFQLVDDLLGIWGDPDRTGKPVHSDLRHRKKSLPVVAALVSGTAAGRDLAALYAGEPPLPDTDVARAARLVEAAGARDWCRAAVGDELERALHHLRTAVDDRAAGDLATLARLIAGRDH